MSDTKFPGPYLNTAKKDDSIMEYVPMHTTGIGANSASLPNGKITSSVMGLDHVSNNGTGPAVKNKF